jgi:hypothetical protein
MPISLYCHPEERREKCTYSTIISGLLAYEMSKKKSLNFLFQQFEDAVYLAFKKFSSSSESYYHDSLITEFVTFSIYDNDRRYFKRPDKKETPAILWEHIHPGFSDILWKLLKPYSYLGFGVFLYLKYLEHSVKSCHLVVDAPLKRNKEEIINGSIYNFEEAIPLTAACFNIDETGDSPLTPIVIHWQSPDFKRKSTKTKRKNAKKISEITITCPIPKAKSGDLQLNYNDIELSGCIKVRGNLKKKTFLERLEKFHKSSQQKFFKNHVSKKDLEKRFAWTVTYFAYVYELNRKYHHKNSSNRPLKNLSIFFMPSTFSPRANSALLLPLKVDSSQLNEVIEKILLISRAIGLPIEEAQPLVKLKSIEGRKKGAHLSATISGHEAGAQLVSMRDLIPYITDEKLEKTVRKLIFGSINYIHLYLADNPNTARIKDFYIAKDESIKSWVEKIAKFSWQISLAREIRDEEIKTELLNKLEDMIEKNMPEIKFEISEDLFFKPSVDIETKYPNFRPTFSRWLLAALSNSIKWSGQIKGVNNLNNWVEKKSNAFKSIRVEISQDKEEQTTIAILNKYHYHYTDLKKNKEKEFLGTEGVLRVINEDLPVKIENFTFDFNKNNIDEWETSIILEGEIFKCVTNQEKQEA